MTTTSVSLARRSLTALLALIAGLALVAVSAAGPARAADTDDILSGLNSARGTAGLAPVVRDSRLDTVALDWAKRMAAAGTLSHNPDVGTQIPSGWNGYGENVAHGFATGDDVTAGWTASPDHYANMVGAYTSVGIAFLPADGSTWAVEVFADYAGTAAVATVETAPTGDAAAEVAPTQTSAATPAPGEIVVTATAEPASSVSPVVYLAAAAVLLVLLVIGATTLNRRRGRRGRA
ncbi:uncharacterized protein YkwD [Conyzicola lurida]|uniref:Uncharacterized protein YkwD n=1 Tax=Conyzicola lurida TaxID=1172621 RepID=A0A841AMT6_9MICO|nr:CAP domain-containing protein [Conyzicola lurida]MBB5842739.1 uncharacterized protein YkwD [Conyzicola lurida]